MSARIKSGKSKSHYYFLKQSLEPRILFDASLIGAVAEATAVAEPVVVTAEPLVAVTAQYLAVTAEPVAVTAEYLAVTAESVAASAEGELAVAADSSSSSGGGAEPTPIGGGETDPTPGGGGLPTPTPVPSIEGPVAGDDFGSGIASAEGTAISLNVLANDTFDLDPNAGPLSIISVSDAHVTINADNTLTYKSDPDFSGVNIFQYTVADANGNTDIADVTVSVTPVTTNDSYSTTAGELAGVPVSGNVLDNDFGSLSVTLGTGPEHGVVVLNENGSFTYTPHGDFSGIDRFYYIASSGMRARLLLDGEALLREAEPISSVDGEALLREVEPISSAQVMPIGIEVKITVAPVLTNDSYSTTAGELVGVPVSGNVLDNDFGSLAVTLGTAPEHGVVVLNANGSFTYTPDGDFSGIDKFSYIPSSGGMAARLLLDGEALLREVEPISSAQVMPIGIEVQITVTPVAMDDSGYVTAGEMELSAGGLLANDIGSDLMIKVPEGPITTTAGGSVMLSADGTFIYNPALDFSGTDMFSYVAVDSSGQEVGALVTIIVNPVANDDGVFTILANMPLSLDILSNDIVSNLQSLTIAIDPANGTVVINPDNTVLYIPNTNFVGEDSFTYKIVDGEGNVDTGTVKLMVEAIPLAANQDFYNTAARRATGGVLVVDAAGGVLANDAGTGMMVIEQTDLLTVQGALVTISADGSFIYTAKAGFSGYDSFTYTIKDVTGEMATAGVTIKVVPIAVNDRASVVKQQTYHGTSVLANDIGSGLVVISNTNAGHGSLIVNADGTYTYKAEKGFLGIDTFTYTAQDSSGQTYVGTVTILVAHDASDESFRENLSGLLSDFGCSI